MVLARQSINILTLEQARTAGDTFAGDVDFATYKAVAMACDNGATLPSSPAPVIGQWFLHTPTGRKVLMQYDGSNWIPLHSLGTMTMYVDATDGTDDQVHGTGVDSDAFATIQYAVDSIPPTYSGDVTININAETYSEVVTIQGKNATGAYTITFQGAVSTIESLTADSGCLEGKFDFNQYHQYAKVIRDSGTWTTNQRQYKWIKFTSGNNDDDYKMIESNTTTDIRPVGRFLGGAIGAGDTFDIQEPATTLNDLRIGNYQANVVVSDIILGFTAGTNQTLFGDYCQVDFYRCSFPYPAGANSLWSGKSNSIRMSACYTPNVRIFIRGASKLTCSGGINLTGGLGGQCLRVDEGATIYFADGHIIDGATIGEVLNALGRTNHNGDFLITTGSTFRAEFRNCALGIDCYGNSVAGNVTNNYVIFGIARQNSTLEWWSTSVTADKLVDTNNDFTTLGVQVGDKLENITDKTSALVTAIDSATQLSLDTDIFTAINKRYLILDVATLNTTDSTTSTGGQLL